MYRLTPSSSSVLAWVSEHPNADWTAINDVLDELGLKNDDMLLQVLHALKGDEPSGANADDAKKLAASYKEWSSQNARWVEQAKAKTSR